MDFSECPLELPIDILRVEVQRIIEHYTEVFQCPRDFVTSAVFCIISAVCGKHVIIDTGKYRNHPNHWICIVAPSGSNKSAPIKALLEPIHKIESDRYKIYQEKYQDQNIGKKGEGINYIPLTVSDVTPEELYNILCEKNNSKEGLLYYRDEIKGFFDDIGRYNRSGELSLYLSIWDCTTFSVNRKTTKSLLIEDPYVCFLGSIQPETFKKVFDINLAEAGFIQRWLFVFPDPLIEDFYSDKTLDRIYSTAWEGVISNIMKIHDMTLTLSPEAKQLYIDYYNFTIKEKMNAHPYVQTMLSKLRVQVLKWCAITHILSCNESDEKGSTFILPSSTIISAQEMKYSIECMRYFEYCGHKALSQISGIRAKGHRTKAELICDLVYSIGIDKVNLTAFAEALGVSRQYVSKVIHQDPRYKGCGCDDARSPPFIG